MVQHAFTVDVEDWYHGIPIHAQEKARACPRLDRSLGRLLDLLAEYGVRGTFFLLGPVARDWPGLVRRMVLEGHEAGCHGWSHELLYRLTPAQFREETRQAMEAISDLTGAPVQSYRAAYFSITRQSFWALEILAELGIRYDSSIFPVKNWRYGIPDFEPRPHRVDTPSGPVYEFPISVRRVFGRTAPVSGGAYFRLYPYVLTRANFRALERRGQPVVFYIHPWELDPEHPRVPFDRRARMTHYFNLRSTEPRLHRLLGEFRFGTLAAAIEQVQAG